MSDRSSSPTNTTRVLYECFDVQEIISVSGAFAITKFFLLLPLSIFILHLGQQRWRQQRSFSTTSHSDFFHLHMAGLELLSEGGWILHCCGFYTNLPEMTMVGFYAFFIVFPGQISFHILTCVDRYVAVVHPVTYLGLKQSGGVRIRNISIGCVWLLCFGWMGVTTLYMPLLPVIPFFSFLVVSLLVVTFCSISVLHVLVRPGPGGDRERVDQSKKRAFCTLVAILGVLWLLFAGILVCLALHASPLLSDTAGCVVMMSAIWFNLPSSFVSPLLYLHRAGKLCCSSSAD